MVAGELCLHFSLFSADPLSIFSLIVEVRQNYMKKVQKHVWLKHKQIIQLSYFELDVVYNWGQAGAAVN